MRQLTVVVVLLAALGCATAPKPTIFSNSQVYPEDFDTVWTAVIEAFADNSWPIDNMEKDSGLITTDWMQATNRDPVLADCGKDMMGEPREGVLRKLTAKFTVFVKSTAAGSEVRITCNFKAAKEGGECLSKGVFETKLMENIGAILAAE